MTTRPARWCAATFAVAFAATLLGCPLATTTPIDGGDEQGVDCSALFLEYFEVAQQAGAAAANCTDAAGCQEFCDKFAELQDLLEQLVDCFGDELTDIEEALARAALDQLSADADVLCGS